MRICRFLLRSLLSVWFAGNKLIVPPIKNPILLKSGIALASDIREGKIKSEDAVKAYCSRIREVNPYINAVCDERFNAAISEAQAVDKLIESQVKPIQQLEDETPLLGVPFTVKIMLGVKGMACNAGSAIHKDVKAHEDAECVALMKKAGAICLAVTNCPPFGLNCETNNSIYGRTSNPYDTTKSPGGSSGGESAIIGAGASVIGIGNDLAGSIRLPCNFTGIFGHKPSLGLISNTGTFPRVVDFPVNKFIATGPMCRYAEDLVLVTKILSGPNSTSLKFDSQVDFSKLKLYYFIEEDGNPLSMKISNEVKSTITSVATYFRSRYGTNIEHINLGELKTSLFVFVQYIIGSLDGNANELLAAGKKDLSPLKELIKFLFLRSKLTVFGVAAINMNKLPMVYRSKNNEKAEKCLKKLQDKLDSILNENSILLLPSFPTPAYYHYEFAPLLATCVSFTAIFNVLGLPVTQCPIRLSNDGLPIGLQIVGAKENDHLLLSCALELEKAFGGWKPPNLNAKNDLAENKLTLEIT